MPAAKRRLKNVDVQFISLVDKGANQKAIIFKSEGQAETPVVEKVITITKVDDEKRLVYGTVYAPDEVDSHGDTMSAEEVEKAAHAFMKAARTNQVDQQHNYQTGPGHVVESWLNKGSDAIFPDEKEGAWHVAIKVESEETWALVKSGTLQGLSLAGMAEVEQLTKADGDDTSPDSDLAANDAGVVSRFLKSARELFRSEDRSAGRATGGLVPAADAEQTEKDFAASLAQRKHRDAVYALNDALDRVLYDKGAPGSGAVQDKAAALISEASQFIAYLKSLDTSTVEMAENTAPVTGAQKAADAPETGAETAIEKTAAAREVTLDVLAKQVADLTELVKGLQTPAVPQTEPAPEQSGEAQLAELQKEVEAAKARQTEAEAKISELEKRSAGRQSQEGRTETTEKTEKGIRFF